MTGKLPAIYEHADTPATASVIDARSDGTNSDDDEIRMVNIGREVAMVRCVDLLRSAAAVGSCQAMHRLGSLVLTGEWSDMRGMGSEALHLLEFAGKTLLQH